MRVLMIDDNCFFTQSVELLMKDAGVNFTSADGGDEGIDLLKNYDFDLVLLDVNMPDMDGFQVIRAMRDSKINVPVMFLSADNGSETKVKAFSAGADDYVTKPFNGPELVARAKAIVRRAKGHSRSVVEIGELVIDLDTKTARVGDKLVPLTGKEYSVLEMLAIHKDTTITKEMFLNHMYGGMDEPDDKIIDVFVCKVRKKLMVASGGVNYVETVWGRGYLLRQETAIDRVKAA